MGGELQIAGGHRGGAIDHEAANFGVAGAAAENQFFAVQQDVEDVFTHAGNGGVLVVDASDADSRDGGALKAAHQDAPKGGAKSGGLASIERADDEDTRLGLIVSDLIVDAVNLVLQHGRKSCKGKKPEGGR